ncbi:MAG: nickel pincer cofactor biosynthesis protein LarC [Candidatus Thorarchaeota archaeon]|nr:nickel pincer cofactor biosynthesis protein LarC [Candidatus Thorarchaeota archaeon]
MANRDVLFDGGTAGASGDMILSALIDLLGDKQALDPVAAGLLIYDPTLRVSFNKRQFEDASGLEMDILLDEDMTLEPQALRNVLATMSREVELSDKAAELARDSLDALFRAESRAHNEDISDIHLHELGSVDTVLDIVGTAYLLDKADLLGDSRLLVTNLAVGSGTITTAHGELEVPVPAVSELLKEFDIPFHAGPAQTEVLTPTAAAILGTIADQFVESAQGFEVEKEAFGFGSRDLGEIPNILRIAVGNASGIGPTVEEEDEEAQKEPVQVPETETVEEVVTSSPKPKAQSTEEELDVDEGWGRDEVIVIETNVDDTDGEAIGTLFEFLLDGNLAYDAVIIPAYGKKNRPCFVVKVITTRDKVEQAARVIIRHLGTLGIRYTEWNRIKAARETIACRLEIEGKEYMVRVKVSRAANGTVVNIKPEADDVLKVARETGIPIRELKPRIAMQAHAITE